MLIEIKNNVTVEQVEEIKAFIDKLLECDHSACWDFHETKVIFTND